MTTTRRALLMGTAATVSAIAAGWGAGNARAAADVAYPVSLSDAEWRRRLTADQYEVLRRDGTERPFSSPLNHEARRGRFGCAGCDAALFSSAAKFDSGTGWPSFWQPLPGAVGEERDASLGIVRAAVRCATCGGHLGHVFDDGPKPTGLRYCMNGVALKFTSGSA